MICKKRNNFIREIIYYESHMIKVNATKYLAKSLINFFMQLGVRIIFALITLAWPLQLRFNLHSCIYTCTGILIKIQTVEILNLNIGCKLHVVALDWHFLWVFERYMTGLVNCFSGCNSVLYSILHVTTWYCISTSVLAYKGEKNVLNF